MNTSHTHIEDDIDNCECCDERKGTNERDCCKMLCDECVKKHDVECEDYLKTKLMDDVAEFEYKNKIKYANWSIYELNGEKWTIEKFSEKHPYSQCNKLVCCFDKEGQYTRIDKNKHTTWLDLFKLCDKQIGKYRGDHRFIELFRVEGKTLVLWTGS